MTDQQREQNIITLNSLNNEHHIVIANYKNSIFRGVLASIRLIPLSFKQRLIEGFKYITGTKYDHPQYEDFIFKPEHAPELMEVITKLVGADNNLIHHAMSELKAAGYFDGTAVQAKTATKVLELLAVVSMLNYSAESRGSVVSLFHSLVNYELISLLTFKDDEWEDQSEISGYPIWQNKRASNVFKDSTGIYSVDAFNKKVVSTRPFGSDKIVKKRPSVTYTGGPIFETKESVCTGRGFRRVFFTDEDIAKGRIPTQTISLPATEIEVQKDDWLMFIDHRSALLKELNSLYRVQWFDAPELKGKAIISLDSSYGL